MRSVQTDGSAHAHRARTSPACLAVCRHCRRVVFRRSRSFRIHLPASLCSPGVTPLPRYYGRSDSCGLALPARPGRSPCFMYQTFRPFRLQPPVSSRLVWFLTLTPQRARASPSGKVLGLRLPSRLATTTGRIEFVILRTSRSPPVALHPLSRGRSYFRLQAGERMPEEDFHLSDQVHFEAHRVRASARTYKEPRTMGFIESCITNVLYCCLCCSEVNYPTAGQSGRVAAQAGACRHTVGTRTYSGRSGAGRGCRSA